MLSYLLLFLVLTAPYRTLTMAFCVHLMFYVYYPHWCVGNSQQEDEPAPLAVNTPKPDNSSGTTSASDDADGASTLPVNTACTSAASQGTHLITLGAHAQGLLPCVCVYLSVPALAASASVETSKQRYSRVSLRLFLDFDSWIFEKPFRSKVIARKSQYAN